MALHCSCNGRYTCDSANQTLEWMKAIAEFLTPLKNLLNAHVVNFFKDRLWESVDREWMDCLRREPVENLLKIPSGAVQKYWPASLKEFIIISRSLVLPREPRQLQMILPDLRMGLLSSVLAQGMNMKKKHEVEILAAVVSEIANHVGARMIIDVGAGQGYLAQVLSFEHQLSVLAIDASSHHGTVTSARAERIKKHYEAKIRKSQYGNKHLNLPQTITCHVLSSDTLKTLSATFLCKENDEPSREAEKSMGGYEVNGDELPSPCNGKSTESSLVLAGLHACGDLSVTMLRTFLDCNEIKALVSVGCCYNLLSEQSSENVSHCGFPVSDGAKLSGLWLGKNARDLGCQVLDKYFPEVMVTSPSIGRQGKASRRRQLKRAVQSQASVEESNSSIAIHQNCQKDAGLLVMKSTEADTLIHLAGDNIDTSYQSVKTMFHSSTGIQESQSLKGFNRYAYFEEFSKSGLSHLGLMSPHEIDLIGIWKEALPFSDLVGPYWSLRAALGPLVETFLLLDRLLLLQEQPSLIAEVALFPLFDPSLSPRNVAIIARKS